MKITGSEQTIDHVIDDQFAEFSRYLGAFWNVEIGYITKISSDGTATVAGFSIDNGTQVIWDNVEVIRIGTTTSSINTNLSGATCLLFRPRSAVINMAERTVDFGAGLFNRSGIKALPITTGSEDIIQFGTDIRGSWYFQGDGYKVEFAKNQFVLYKDESPLFALTSAGTIVISTATYDYRMLADGTVQQIYYDSNDKIMLANIYASDGTVTTLRLAKDVLSAAQMDNGLLNYTGWLWKEVISNDGIKTITQYDGNNTSLLVVTEGSGVTIETKSNGGDITLNANGSTITIENGGDITINGHLKVTT